MHFYHMQIAFLSVKSKKVALPVTKFCSFCFDLSKMLLTIIALEKDGNDIRRIAGKSYRNFIALK